MTISAPGELICLIERIEKADLELQKKMIIYKQLPGVKLESSHLNLTKEKEKLEEDIKRTKNKGIILDLAKRIKMLTQIEALSKKVKTLKPEIHKVMTKEHKIKSVFVTFHKIKHRNMFLNLLSKNFSHLLQKFNREKEQKLLEEDKLVYAEEPPLPSNIKWKNYNLSSCEKFTRRLGIWSVYILMFVIRNIRIFN